MSPGAEYHKSDWAIQLGVISRTAQSTERSIPVTADSRIVWAECGTQVRKCNLGAARLNTTCPVRFAAYSIAA
jgi:hypothetical protein